MSYYIIIRGPLGSGKSTIAEKFALILDAKHVCMDEVLQKYDLDKIPEEEPFIPVENFIKANEIIFTEIKKFLSLGRIVIVDGCFYHKEAIEQFVENIFFNHYIFTLKAPVEICVKRDSERKKTYGEGAVSAVYSLVSRFDYGININATGSIEDTIKKIVSYLPKSEK